MIANHSYRNALIAAIMLHFSLAIMLFWESSSNERPVLTVSKQTEPSPAQPMAMDPQQQAIKAVSVDSQEVLNTVNQLKKERLQKQMAEDSRQKRLTQQAEQARKQRVVEQQRLEKLKNESVKLAIAHKKQIEDEKKHLKDLAEQQKAEEKHLAEMKKQAQEMKKKQQETEHLAELKKKKETDLAAKQAKIADQAKVAEQENKLAEQKKNKLAEQERQAKINTELAREKQAAAAQAALDAQKSADMSGEVNKYKALIIGAISRQWILPENADSKISSQFRIRLAPDGAVLEVSLTRSSGDAILDRSAQSAIYKASPLPVPSDPDAFNVFRDISLTVRPENARG